MVIFGPCGLRITNYKLGKNIHLFSGSLYLCYQRGLIDWLEAWNPDALIMEANPRYLSTPPAVKWMHKRNRPVIGWGLGAPAGARRKGIENKVWSSFINQFDATIAYSQRGAEEYAGFGFPHDKIFVAHNSVSAPPTAKPTASRTMKPSTMTATCLPLKPLL